MGVWVERECVSVIVLVEVWVFCCLELSFVFSWCIAKSQLGVKDGVLYRAYLNGWYETARSGVRKSFARLSGKP